jgi:hypothetical protein
MFERVAWKYLGEADKDHKAEETRGKDAVMTAAIATDKMRLLREQSTANVGVTANPMQQAIDFILECRKRGKTNAEIVAALDYFEQVDRSVREDAKLVIGVEVKEIDSGS